MAERFIDAEAVKQKAIMVEKLDGNGCPYEFLAVPLITIKNFPTIEAKPVVHAHWEKPTYINGRAFSVCHCSACEEVPCGIDENTKYCPNCGAQMDELVNNTDKLNCSEKPSNSKEVICGATNLPCCECMPCCGHQMDEGES